MSSDVAVEFWKRVVERKADTEKERVAILLELTEEGKMDAVSETQRTKEEYVEDLKKEFDVWDTTKGNDVY